MKKHTILILFLLPCLLLSSCGTATDTTTTTAATAEAPRDPLPAEERYTDETGRYICKNVAINTEMEQYFVPYDGGSLLGDTSLSKIGCYIADKYDRSTMATVRKIASESYFIPYEDNRTPLAYTLSTLEIVSLPDTVINYLQLRAGDTIVVLEPYAFSPASPNVIYHSHIHWRQSLHLGIMELGEQYLVNIMAAPAQIKCYENDKEHSDAIDVPDNCYFLYNDIYPINSSVYNAFINDYKNATDLAIPTADETIVQLWSAAYQWAYEQYVAS